MLVIVDTDKVKARAFDGILEAYADNPRNQRALRDRINEITDKYLEVEQLIFECDVPCKQIKRKDKNS